MGLAFEIDPQPHDGPVHQFRTPRSPVDETRRLISFIIPAHNEEELIGATLDAIDDAARPLELPFEVIVVNDASSDRTADVALAHGARVVTVDLRQISAVRNAGARVSQGSALIFVDADTVVSPEAVGRAVESLRQGAVGGGACVRWDGAMPWWAQALAATTLCTMRIAKLAAGCFLFCTRHAFDEVGGFDETVYATEELWMSRALGRHGPFVILSESVTTSGRKLRTYSGVEMIRMTLPLLVRGFDVFRDRTSLALWYGERRSDKVIKGRQEP